MLLMQGAALDQQGAAATEAAVGGVIDGQGNIVPAQADPNAAAMEWLIIPELMAWAITTALPETKEHYTQESKMELAQKIAPVAEKYGWNGPGDMPELGLAVGAIGFSMPAVLAYKTRKMQIEAARQEAQAGTVNVRPE